MPWWRPVADGQIEADQVGIVVRSAWWLPTWERICSKLCTMLRSSGWRPYASVCRAAGARPQADETARDRYRLPDRHAAITAHDRGDSAGPRRQLRRDRRARRPAAARAAGRPRAGARRPTAWCCPGIACCAPTGTSRLPPGSRGFREQVRRLAAEGVLVDRGRVDLAAHGWERDLDALLWDPAVFLPSAPDPRPRRP